jgi:hypothetical protein
MKRPISDVRRRLKRAQATQVERMIEEMRCVALKLWIDKVYSNLESETREILDLAELEP